MSDTRLVRRLAVVAQRHRRLSRLKVTTAVWLTAAALGAILSALAPVATLWVVPIVAVAGIGISFWFLRARTTDVQQAGLLLEHQYPALDSKLLTALGLQRPVGETYHYLQEQVLSDVLDHARRHPWAEAVPTNRIRAWHVANLCAVSAFAAVLLWSSRSGSSPGGTAAIDSGGAGSGLTNQVVVEPGDVELELGSSLIVTAKFLGPTPDSADLLTVAADETIQRHTLSRSLDDPLFGGRIADVQSDLTYRVESAAGTSADFQITTFEYPALLRADALIATPAYSVRPEERIEDVRRVSVYAGSMLTLVCRFNKPVVSASLRPDEGDSLTFGTAALVEDTPDDPDDVSASVSWQPAESQTLELVVTDEAGRGLKEPVKFHIEVLPNRPPELAVTFPSHDVQVSPLEELSLEATAWDDFGVQEYGLVYRLPSGDERTVVMGNGTDADAGTELKLEHLLPLEELGAAERDLLSYSFYADDQDENGAVRRTYSDVFFAEVRHFDEEYREQRGQPGGGGGGGGGGGQQNPAQQLVDLQRQIVIATWNSFRNWTEAEVSEESSKYRDEIRVIGDSQAAAAGQLQEMSGRLEDAVAQQHAALAGEHMAGAQEQLTLAEEKPSAEPLTGARTESQAAYQELLRLRDRLHVVTQQQGGGGGGGSQGMDRQLGQLELRNDRNRYEQESQAQSPQEQQSQAQLDVLNHLRELAQRQEDLNERIKELLDQRRTAQTDAEREEIERELKRLRDEQQELLRDADELRERMMQPQNQRQMADAREQLDQTRSDLQQASDALQDGEASRALTSGTRAQQRLEEMKEDFRRRTAGAFDESMRELQQDARELADRQRAIADELKSDDAEQEGPRPTLREPEHRADISESLAEQRQRLSTLTDRMRELIEQSEATEPLLSDRLYDAILDARTDQPEESLRAAQELLRRGFAAEGMAAEEQARRGIERLEQGVNEAAEGILGDELETLQRAEQQVADLARALKDELALADSQRQSAGAAGRAASGQPEEEPDQEQRGGGARSGKDEEEGESRPGGSEPSDRESNQAESEQSPGQGAGSERTPNSGEGRGESSEQAQNGGGAGEQASEQSSPGENGQGGGPPSGSNAGGGRGGAPSPRDAQDGERAGMSLADLFRSGGPEQAGGSGGGGRPLTGQDFTGWSDQLREVENMLSEPELRSQAGSIRERARDVRRDFNRHSKPPDWEMVRAEIYGPLLELQTRLAEEIARRRPQDQLVPIDRDPVPDQYTDLVREYYEQLSRVRLPDDRDPTRP